MSIQLQIALPLFAAAVALILIAILRKYRKAEVAVWCLAMISLGVLALTMPEVSFGETVSQQQNVDVTVNVESSLMLAQQYMCAEEYGMAMEVLEDLQQTAGDDPEVNLAVARCKLLRKDYAAAAQAYSALASNEKIAEEAKLAKDLYTASMPNSNAVFSQLLAEGKDPGAYGLTQVQVPNVSFADTKELILKRLKAKLSAYEEEKKNGEDIVSVTKKAAALAKEFLAFNSTGTYDEDAVKSGINSIKNAIGEIPALKQNKHLRLSLLKGYILQKEYDEIAGMVDDHSGGEELMIATELYISDMVDKNDFSEEYLSGSQEQRERVLDACKEALSLSREALDDEEYAAYKEKVTILEEQMEDPAAHNLKEQLVEQAQSADPTQRSKNYLTLARLEQSQGNDQQADAYISDALGSATISDDVNYREPMMNMLQIAQGSADTEEVKNVAQYAQQAMDNALPLDLTTIGSASQKVEFTDELQQTVNETAAKLNIGKIDTSKFPTVTARVQIQSSKWTTRQQIIDNLMVYDCNGEIQDFRLEKLQYDKSNIILLCDVSGSMDGSVEDMKNAIVAFSAGMREGEQVCVIGFDSSIEFVHPFSDDPQTVAGYADSLYAGGGTALYPSLLACKDYLNFGVESNNIIIAMTDGQDGAAADDDTMRTQIRALADETGATVYTLGLGDVDTAYLTNMAEYGNGSFLYADSQEKLAGFYEFIHGQLRNQYVLTFTAANKTTTVRKLELQLREEMCTADKTYYLKETAADPNAPVAPDVPDLPDTPDTLDTPDKPKLPNIPFLDELVEIGEDLLVAVTSKKIYGLNVHSMAQTGVEQTVRLTGERFKKEDDIDVYLMGTLKYKLKVTFVDDKTYEVVIPADIGFGTYDLEVRVAKERFVLEGELEVFNPDEHSYREIGGYWFVSDESSTRPDGTLVMSGNVVMNGWLRFKGNVVLSQGVGVVTVTDTSGAFVVFSNNATGLAKTLASKSINLWLGRLGTFELSMHEYDPDDREDFDVDEIALAGILNMDTLKMSGVAMSVYPDNLSFRKFKMDLDLPLLEQLFANLLDDDDDPTLENDIKVLINSHVLGIDGKLEYSDGRDVKVGAKLPIRVSELSVEVNTIRENYDFAMQVKFKQLKDILEGLGGSISFREGRFDAFSVNAEGTLPIIKTPVPVSFSKLGFGVSGFSKDTSDDGLVMRFLNKTFKAEFEMDIADVTELIPDLAKFLGIDDAPLIGIRDGEMETCFGDFNLAISAKASFLDKIEVGKVELAIGKVSYTNELLGLYGETNYGLSAKITQGITLEADDLLLAITGSGTLDLGAPYTSVGSESTGRFQWGAIDEEITADSVIALFMNKAGNLQFSIKIRHVIGIDIVKGKIEHFEWGKEVGK